MNISDFLKIYKILINWFQTVKQYRNLKMDWNLEKKNSGEFATTYVAETN